MPAPGPKNVLHSELDYALRLAEAEAAGRGRLTRMRMENPARAVHNSRLHHRVVELRVVKSVEKLGTELDAVALGDIEILRQIHVPIIHPAALNNTLAGVPETAGRGV